MAKLMIKELENIYNSIPAAISESDKNVSNIAIEQGKEFYDYMNEVMTNGKTRSQIFTSLKAEKRQLLQELAYLDGKEPARENEIILRLKDINQVILDFEESKKNYPELDVADQERRRNEERAKVMAAKLQETFDVIEAEVEHSKNRLENLISKLSFDIDNNELRKEIGKEQTRYTKLNKQLAVVGRLQEYEGKVQGQSVYNEILEGLDPKSEEYALFSSYIRLIAKLGNVAKSKSMSGNDPVPPIPPKPPEDDDKKKDDDIIDINDYDLNIEEAPQMPKNISQKPEKTWKTVAAVALGIGAAAGTFAAFGVAGAGVVFVASGIARKFIKKKEKTIKEEEQKLQEYAEKIEDYNNQSEDIRKTITQYVEKYNTTDDEEMKKAIKAKIDEFRGNLARNNEFVAGEKAKMEEIVKRIYPDLKADEYNGPQKITSIEDAKEKIIAKGRKFKAYLGSKEGLRDARWFMNAAQITSAALVAVDFVSGLANPSVTNSVVQTPPTETITPPGETVVDIPTEPGLYDGISVGGDVSGYNLSVGHDTASWALDGTNTESLISEYVNSTNSIFKGFRIQSGNGTIPLDLKGMNLTEFLNANPGIDPSTIVADVASKDGISQAWVSIDELVSGLGGKSL